MPDFPPLTHVALTVRDLSVSVPWYQALFNAQPVLDEDTEPDMHHTVYLLGNGTLIGLHQHQMPAPPGQFSEYRVGLDHLAFGCARRRYLGDAQWLQSAELVRKRHGVLGGFRPQSGRTPSIRLALPAELGPGGRPRPRLHGCQSSPQCGLPR